MPLTVFSVATVVIGVLLLSSQPSLVFGQVAQDGDLDTVNNAMATGPSSNLFMNFIAPMIKYNMSSPTVFTDYVLPIIKQGILTKGNKTETEADAIVHIISAAITNRQKPETAPASNSDVSQQWTPKNPGMLFKTFVYPFIQSNMINGQNKTATEADAILSIISASMATNTHSNVGASGSPKDVGATFFTNYIAPTIRIHMIESGNKTEVEADGIINTIISGIKNRTGLSKSSPTGEVNSDEEKGNFFEYFISPLVKYHMMTTGNKTDNVADSILNIILSTSIHKKSMMKAAKNEPQEVASPVEDVATDQTNSTFFQKFIVPIIRYRIVNKENKTAEEADAILDTMFPGKVVESEGDKAAKPRSFFEDFIVPIIRNKIITEGTKNQSEVDAIIRSIVASEKEEKNTKSVDDSSKAVDGGNDEDASGTVTQKFIDGMLLPDMKKVIDDVIKDSTSPELMTPDVATADITAASKLAVDAISEDLEEAIEMDNDDDRSNESSDDESSSNKGSKSPDDSSSDESSKSSDDSQFGQTSESSDESKSESSSNGSDGRRSEGSQSDGRQSEYSQSEGSQSEGSSKSSTETAEDDSSTPVDSFVAKYLEPVLMEKINGLQTLAGFFSNPKVIEELRGSLESLITREKFDEWQNSQEKNGDDDGNKDKDDGEYDTADGDAAHLNPIKWFVGQLVVPELQRKVKKLDSLAQLLQLARESKSVSNTIYTIMSKRAAEHKEDIQGDGKQNGNSPSTAKDFMTENLVPLIKQAVQKFQNVTSYMSSTNGKTGIVGEVNNFIDRIVSVKVKMADERKSKSDGNQIPSPEAMLKRGNEPHSSAMEDEEDDADSEESFGGLVGEVIASAFGKSGERLKTLADKISDPAVAKKIANVFKNKINTFIEKRRQERSSKDSETSLTVEEIIKRIVKMKIQIMDDKRKIIDLDIRMRSDYSGEKLEFILQKMRLVEDIKNCSITIKHLFISLRTGQAARVTRPGTPTKGSAKTSSLISLQNNILQINQAKENLESYKKQLSIMDEKLSSSYNSSYRLKLVREKLKIVWAIKDEGIKLENLYMKMKMDREAADAEQKTDVASQPEDAPDAPESTDMEFTDAEMSKYAGLLQELNYAQKPPSSSDNDPDGNSSSVVAGLVVAGVGLIAIVIGTVGALVYRRRGGRNRLYTYIPSEEKFESPGLFGSKDTYGSCK